MAISRMIIFLKALRMKLNKAMSRMKRTFMAVAMKMATQLSLSQKS